MTIQNIMATITPIEEIEKINEIITDISLKAIDNAVVHLSGDETMTGVKTFSSSPLVPTKSSGDSTTAVANTEFVTTADTALQTQINNKANTTDVVNLTGAQTISGTKTFTGGVTMSSSTLLAKQDSNLEGGQINFERADNDPLSTNPTIDLLNGAFRIFGADSNGVVHIPLTIDIENNVVGVVDSDVEGSAVSTVAKSKSSNGYFKLGNGLLIQWGRYTTVSGTDEHTISFSTPFSSATSYTIVKNYQSNHSTDALDKEVSFYNMTATGATTYSPTGDTSQISWLAIGY